MSLPEIPEAEATGRVADIYRAILDATGLPSTNLVWRHMACHPGVLEWAYDALEGAFTGGAFRALGAEIASSMPPPAMPSVAADGGLDRATLERAASVMAFYNRANPINLAALSALRRALAGETSESAFDRPVPGDDPLPPLPEVAREVDCETAARMAALARTINDADSALMPTALRHLANWPATIAALQERVEALVASGALKVDAQTLRRRAAEGAARVPLAVPVSGRPSEATRHALEATIDLFLTPISRMIVIGRGFEAALRS